MPKFSKASLLGTHGVFCFISVCKFGSFNNPFAMIASLSELYFRFRRFVLLVQAKKMISVNYGNTRSSCKPWRWLRLDLIIFRRDIYVNSNLDPLRKLTSSSRSIEFKDIFPWNISQMITKTTLIGMTIAISNAMKLGILLWWIWWKFNGSWDNSMIRISQWRESHCRKNTSIRRNK